jgi:hypothetical protein
MAWRSVRSSVLRFTEMGWWLAHRETLAQQRNEYDALELYNRIDILEARIGPRRGWSEVRGISTMELNSLKRRHTELLTETRVRGRAVTIIQGAVRGHLARMRAGGA